MFMINRDFKHWTQCIFLKTVCLSCKFWVPREITDIVRPIETLTSTVRGTGTRLKTKHLS